MLSSPFPAKGAILSFLCVALFSALLSNEISGAEKQTGSKPVKIAVERIPFEREKPLGSRFGKLQWLGSLRLSSPSKKFGGFSGLAIDKTGTRLLAVSDLGTWLTARLAYRNGYLLKMVDARIGKLRGRGGRSLRNKSEQDSESIAFKTPGAVTGTAYIAFERKHRIAVHKVTAAGIGPAIRHLRLPAQIKSAERNKGLEGVVPVRSGPAKGALLTFTEEYLDGSGDHIGWLIGGRKPGRITLKRRGGFAITDLAGLRNGDIVVLERRFRFIEGMKMRMRRIKAGTIRAGAVLDGEVLLESDSLREIDNMEGIAAHQDKTGRDILTIISDDNFNRRFQRTILMQFAIVE